MKALNRKKKPKHHSKVKYKVYPKRKGIVSITRECRCKKYKIVSKQTYKKKY